MRRHEPGVETDGFAERSDGLLELTERAGCDAQTVERERFARVRGGPGLAEFEGLVPGLSGVDVIAPRNEETLAIAHAVAQLEGSPRIRRRLCVLIGVGVHTREQRLRHREIRIELDGPLQMGNRLEPEI